MRDQLKNSPPSTSPAAGSSQHPNGLSLVLATLGRAEQLSRLFESVAGCCDVSIEVIVVDQNEDDRLAPILAAAAATGVDIRHLRIAPRKGLSLARNEGLKVARYSLVGFPDDDCWYESGACKSVLEAFDGNARLDGLVARWLDRHDAHQLPETLHLHAQRRFAGVPIASICLFFRTDLLLNAGGFDERLGLGSWSGSSEETDLVFRLLAQNAHVEFRPEIVVRHHWPGAAIPISGKFSPIFRAAMTRARGTGAMYAKHAMSMTVIARGLFSPVVKAFGMSGGIRGMAYWAGTALGRWQGFMRWRKLRT